MATSKKKDEMILKPGQELMSSPQQVPAYMQQDVGAGTELLAQYIMPPMLKVVQKMAKDELLAKFDVASVIVMPNQELLFDPKEGTPFEFVIIGFYVEFISWNPLERSGESPIRERTTDPHSELAAKCRDQKRWLEPLPKAPTDDKQLFIRNVEHLNFIVIIESEVVEPIPHIISFSRGEHKTGRLLANKVKMRRGPLYGARFAATASQGGDGRKNAKGSWAGLDIVNADDPWVGEDKYEAYKAMSNEISRAMNGGKVQAQYDVDDVVLEPSSAGADSSEF